MDLKGTGVITVDEWLKFCMEHIIAKTATLAAHPILDHGNLEQFTAFVKDAVVIGSAENTELYWFLLELFTEADPDRDGIVMLSDFSRMLDRALETPKKLGMSHPDKNMMGPMTPNGRNATMRCSKLITPWEMTKCVSMNGLNLLWRVSLRRWLLKSCVMPRFYEN